MPWHNKVLRNIEIFDFVIFRDGSYYSLFSSLDTKLNNKDTEKEDVKNSHPLCILYLVFQTMYRSRNSSAAVDKFCT